MSRQPNAHSLPVAAATASRKLAASPMFRALLALDGRRLTPHLLTTAAKRCVHLAERLDILLVNPPKAPTRLLWGLLVHLENSGVDYRLASTDGDLGEQVLIYLQRFLGINLILVDEVAQLEQSISADMARLRTQGYRFVSYTEFCQG